MDRQKQVEEMTRELSNIQTYAYMEIYPCRQKQPNEIVAEHLVRKGWIKPDEDAVVLAREEYDDMFTFKTVGNAGKHCGFYNILDTVRKVEHEETAEKIASSIEDILQLPYKGKTEKQEWQRKGMTEGLNMALEICKEIIGETK